MFAGHDYITSIIMPEPPFSLSSRCIHLIADIAALLERYALRMAGEDALRLRKANKIKTIQGSLAIEGNTLSEQQITDILDGKRVLAPVREIQEVRNALEAYEAFSSFDPMDVSDLLRAHGLMMQGLVQGSGQFREGNVGVFSGARVVHMAPPSSRVPYLMEDLFAWLDKSPDHMLVKSAVFHYEFEFIHPFSDGNGRMGRLWQSLLLSQWNPVFAHLPVENIVHARQEAYYEAIARSTEKADSGIFVEFMLEAIWSILEERLKIGGVNGGVNGVEGRIRELIALQPGLNARTMAGQLQDVPLRTLQRHLQKMQLLGLLEFRGAAKTGGYFLKEKLQEPER